MQKVGDDCQPAMREYRERDSYQCATRAAMCYTRHARVALLLVLPRLLRASLGDRQPGYRACLAGCLASGCVGAACVASCPASPAALAPPLRALAWDCAAD